MFTKAFGVPRRSGSSSARRSGRSSVEEIYSIGTVGLSPAVMGVRIVKNNMGNIPARQYNAQHGRTPGDLAIRRRSSGKHE